MGIIICKLIHYLGVFLLLAGLGGLVVADKDKLKLPTISHGVGLLLILVGGFGMHGMLKIGFPGWFILKLVAWLALGAMLAVAKRKILPPVAAWLIVAVLATLAAWAGMVKPF